MGNLVCGAWGWSYFTLIENILQCRLSRISQAIMDVMRKSNQMLNAIESIGAAEKMSYMQHLSSAPSIFSQTSSSAGEIPVESKEPVQKSIEQFQVKSQQLQAAMQLKEDQKSFLSRNINEIFQFEQRKLEQDKLKVEQELKLVKAEKDSHKELFNNSVADFKPSFGGGQA